MAKPPHSVVQGWHRPHRLRLIGVTVVLAGLLAACSGGSSQHQSPPTAAAAVTSGAYVVPPSGDAAIIASHIKGCADVEAGSVGKGGPDLLSTASCTLLGHVVIVDSFASFDATDDFAALLKGTPTTFADGGHWAAFAADQGAAADQTMLQMQLTNNAGGLLSNALGSASSAAASPDAQQQIAAAVVASIGGKVQTAG